MSTQIAKALAENASTLATGYNDVISPPFPQKSKDLPLMFGNELIKTPKDLESYVQYVYSSLLNLKDEGVVVSSNAILVGRSGARHEIDVFYQFQKTGIIHKVAFECKFLKRKVEKSSVIDFHGKIRDIGSIQGILVSKNGYQKGAKEYANHYGMSEKFEKQLNGRRNFLSLNVNPWRRGTVLNKLLLQKLKVYYSA
ncbi:MAG: restriction endonuclease [Pseudomonadales bacterium]|nr:restriction endonuclease [Pseudomonadales bacterium]